MSYYPTTLTVDELERLQPLSSQLFPTSDSSIDYLLQTALTPLSITQDSLKRDLAYQYIEFRDKRKLENSLNEIEQEFGKGRGKAKLEMTRSQVERLKDLRRSLKVASDRADEEYEKVVLKKPITLPHRLSDSLYLSRSAEAAIKPQPLPTFESFVSRILSSPSSRAQILKNINETLVNDIPTTQSVIISKYSMTRLQLGFLRQERKKMMAAIKDAQNGEMTGVGSLRAEIEEEKRETSDTLAQEISPSPELFSIPIAKPQLPLQSANALADLATKSSLQKKSSNLSTRTSAEKQVVNFGDHRLNTCDSSLRPFEANQLELFSFFVPGAPRSNSTSITDSLEWKPIHDTAKISEILSDQLTSKECEKKSEVRSSSRELRNKLQEAQGGSVTKELRKEVKVDLDTTLLDADDEQQEEENSPDPFVFFHRSHLAVSSNQVVPQDPTPQHVSTSRTAANGAHVPDKTSPPSSLAQTIPIPSPPFPPPYTLHRRRAISLPLPFPSPSAFSLSTSPATRLLEFGGRKFESDENGFIEIDSETSESSPTKPILNDVGEAGLIYLTKEDTREALATPAKLAAVGETRCEFLEAQGKGGRVEESEETRVKESATEGGSSTPRQLVVKSKASREVTKSKVPSLLSENDKLSELSTTSRLSSSLDRFMITRGRQAPEPSNFRINAKRSLPKASLKTISTQSSQPPAPSLPFPIPSFLSLPPTQSNLSPLRVVTFDSLLQMRPLYSALENQQFHLVHRPSRSATSPFIRSDPHLITSGPSCVFYFKLIDLIGNAVREEESPDSSIDRQESIFTTLKRFSTRYDHILVVFEEQQAPRRSSSSSLKPHSYTPPVLEGLSRLSQALSGLPSKAGKECRVNVVCSSGVEYSAEVTRKFVSFVEREDSSENETRPGVDGWGERSWLRDDPLPDESLLLKLSPLLNELNVCAILSFVTSKLFVELAQTELELSFASVCGSERAKRLSFDLHPITTTNSQFVEPSAAPPDVNDHYPSLSLIDSAHIDDEALFEEELKFEDVFDVERYDLNE
ncbi:hypothetical protein JCM5350_001538 [Sporobolomyces pararoseus]